MLVSMAGFMYGDLSGGVRVLGDDFGDLENDRGKIAEVGINSNPSITGRSEVAADLRLKRLDDLVFSVEDADEELVSIDRSGDVPSAGVGLIGFRVFHTESPKDSRNAIAGDSPILFVGFDFAVTDQGFDSSLLSGFFNESQGLHGFSMVRQT